MAPVIIFPAIDLKNGECVRLVRGDMAQATVFNDDPAAQARAFENHGVLQRTADADPDGATAALARLADAGIDMLDVEQTLEDEGVTSFATSFDELLQSLTDKAATF